jgi:hypothetical protein
MMYDKIVQAVEQGHLTWEQVATAALTYLTNAELAHMAIGEEWFINESDEIEAEEKW